MSRLSLHTLVPGILSLWLTTVGLAAAHTIDTAAGLLVSLHVEPNDQIQIGQDALVTLSVSDPAQAFTFPACDCRVTVARIGSEVDAPVLSSVSDEAATFLLKSPTSGQYTIQLLAAPKDGQSFEPLTQIVRIAISKDGAVIAAEDAPLDHTGHLVAAGLMAAYVLVAIARQQLHKKHEHITSPRTL